MELYTASACWASKGCGAYCKNKWAYLQWPAEWESTDLLKDITFLEITLIALSIFLWHKLFYKKIVYYIDNMAVVSILNSKTQKSARVMVLLRFIVYWSPVGHLHFKVIHITSVDNAIADSLSRGQFQRIRALAPSAELKPMGIVEPFKTEFDILIYRFI